MRSAWLPCTPRLRRRARWRRSRSRSSPARSRRCWRQLLEELRSNRVRRRGRARVAAARARRHGRLAADGGDRASPAAPRGRRRRRAVRRRARVGSRGGEAARARRERRGRTARLRLGQRRRDQPRARGHDRGQPLRPHARGGGQPGARGHRRRAGSTTPGPTAVDVVRRLSAQGRRASRRGRGLGVERGATCSPCSTSSGDAGSRGRADRAHDGVARRPRPAASGGPAARRPRRAPAWRRWAISIASTRPGVRLRHGTEPT